MAQQAMAPPRTLDAAIDDHRMWFEVERETAQQGEQRITTLVRVWLWATIPTRAGVLPADPGCRDAVLALERVAAAAVEGSGIDPAPDVEPFHWALYASRQVAGADEIRLGLDVRPPPGAIDSAEAQRERALERLKGALDRVGVSEGAWRPTAAA